MDIALEKSPAAVHGAAHGHDEIRSRNTNYEKRINRLIGRKILVERCVNDHIRDEDDKILVALPESHIDPTIFLAEHQWFSVLLVGEECHYLSQHVADEQDAFLLLPLWGDGIHDIGDSLWIIEERLFDDKDSGVQPIIYLQPKD